MYEIKNIPVEDIPQVLEIYRQGIDTGKSTFTTEVPTPQRWDTAHHKFCRVGAYENGVLIGWAALSPTSARDCYRGVCEVSLYVRTGHHSDGVGTAIMEELIRQSENVGIWTLYANIFASNKASLRMCEKRGFRVIGVREKIAKNKFGVWQDTVNVERRSKVAGVD